MYTFLLVCLLSISSAYGAAYNSLEEMRRGIEQYDPAAVMEAERLEPKEQEKLARLLIEENIIKQPLYTESTWSPVVAIAIGPDSKYVVTVQQTGLFDAYKIASDNITMKQIIKHCTLDAPYYIKIVSDIKQHFCGNTIDNALLTFAHNGTDIGITVPINNDENNFESTEYIWNLERCRPTYAFDITSEVARSTKDILEDPAVNIRYKTAAGNDFSEGLRLFDLCHGHERNRTLPLPAEDVTFTKYCIAPEPGLQHQRSKHTSNWVVCAGLQGTTPVTFFYPFGQLSPQQYATITLLQAIALVHHAQHMRSKLSEPLTAVKSFAWRLKDREQSLHILKEIPTESPFYKFAQMCLR